ncbi:E3 ubiquitin-protein ligase XIAP-like [Ruditapes philippinarum]|uniref:E3 ubiquitin-protein ligase XIAP-like n=1 Tax=Ruditapes philippinarum TaxID=129788 RepID=UPI00295A9776|nr:E3 ubiquitin-protein ligase XIAP-like [Ruditapes philippinarum]
MESRTTRTRVYCVKMVLLLTVMVALHYVTMETNLTTGHHKQYTENKTHALRTESLAKDISNTSKILPCVPDFNSTIESKFGKHGNISLVTEMVTETGNDVLKNRTGKLLSRRQIVLKHLEYTFVWVSSCKDSIVSHSLTIIDSETLIKIAVLLKCVHFLLNKRRQNSAKSNHEKKMCSYDFLFQLTNGYQCSVNVYPFSLKVYINGLEKNSDKSVKCMNNEWARFESFKTFPEECPASALRLAKAGFYSTNNGQEAVCFSCGLNNEVWSDSEAVVDVHKRLSPDCKFINGETTENVSIHEDHKETQSGACGGPEDRHSNRVETEQSQEQRNRQELSFDAVQSTTEHLSSSSINSQESGQQLVIGNGYRAQHSENIPTDDIQHFPGIINERPKHPDYAIKSVRLSSFAFWPSTNVMKPEDLTEAGFFFCGTQDLVRCFFCGGGMKNWEYGDSPWIEHARWFSTCAYLKQCKGEDFVNLCQMSNMTFPTQNNFQVRDLDSQQTNLVADQHIKDVNSIAAKRVLDMGYTQPQVEVAIKQTRQRIGPSEELKAQNLVEYLLDDSNTPASVPTLTSSTSQQQQQSNTSAATNGSNSPRSNSPVASGRQLSPKEERKVLKEENRVLKEQMMCKVCMDKDANTVFLPCGHLVSCVDCANALRKCAVCRTIIQGTVRAYPA